MYCHGLLVGPELRCLLILSFEEINKVVKRVVLRHKHIHYHATLTKTRSRQLGYLGPMIKCKRIPTLVWTSFHFLSICYLKPWLNHLPTSPLCGQSAIQQRHSPSKHKTRYLFAVLSGSDASRRRRRGDESVMERGSTSMGDDFVDNIALLWVPP